MVDFVRLFAAVAALVIGGPAAAVTLATPLGGGNAQYGIMFDIVAGPRAVTIRGGAISLSPGNWDLEIYTRAGTVVNNLSPTGWSLISRINGVSGRGVGTQSVIDFADFSMAANTATGMYITAINGRGVSYTNGMAVGGVVAADANLSIRSGFGRAYAFGSRFFPRNFNGSFWYTVGTVGTVPEPASWAMLIAGFGLVGAAARRTRTAAAA